MVLGIGHAAAHADKQTGDNTMTRNEPQDGFGYEAERDYHEMTAYFAQMDEERERNELTLMRDIECGEDFEVNGNTYTKTHEERALMQTGSHAGHIVGVPAAWTVARVA
jgi:hypothetical protein